ncbi:MAG: GDP-mannose 4,6-dehydratase [Actinobacteria bacterium]|nr:GDP-mannose 4,6-dehydratase [Actinomycetota bacterium]
MKALITGVCGFVGKHLAQYLLSEHECEVTGIDVALPSADLLGLSSFKFCQMDLMDDGAIRSLITSEKFDEVYHLAAQSSVALSWGNEVQTYRSNIFGQLGILSALLECSPETRVLVVGSSEIYGKVSLEEIPIKETTPPRPLSPYAVSKATCDLMAYEYFAAHDVRAYRTRSFNHIGPGQNTKFVCADFARQIADIETGKMKPEIRVGNIEVIRDFTDVRDVVAAYCTILRKGRAGEAYNVCSGYGISISKLLEILLSNAKKEIEVVIDEGRFRPADIPILIGDRSKLTLELGWKPKINIEQSALDVLNCFRNPV